MSEYTPTTDEMRWVYVRADRAALSREEYEAEFDRWLAEYERQMLERAERAEQALKRVRELHESVDGDCFECGESYLPTEHPCPTVEAIDNF